MRRREWIAASAALVTMGGRAMAEETIATAPAEGDEPGAAALAADFAAGRRGSREAVERCLARIDAIDRAGPRLSSVVVVDPEAMRVAARLDDERRAGRGRGPLHGVPVLVKDNIATAALATTCGSLALEGNRPPRDARVVARLREAGLVVLGKNNLSEWANIRSTRSTSGWSAVGGLVRNPYALDRNASGSSSGTAAAIAAGLAPIGVGTETDGSIVSPSSICGIVGLKPTVGRVSRDGIVPISRTQDTAGPMARSVADAALLFEAMQGADPRDPATAAAPADAATAASGPGAGSGAGATGSVAAASPLAGLAHLRRDALRGARLGVARAYLTGFDEADALFGQAIDACRALGAEIVDPVELAAPSYWDAEMTVLLTEMKADLPRWLATFAPEAKVRTLADVVAFNAANREREMAWFGQELFERALKAGGLDDRAYLDALAECDKAARVDGLDRAFAKDRLDALIAPTGGLAWLSDPIAGDHFGQSFSTPAAVARYPHLTVPCGFVRGLPVGFSFVGPAWSERRLLGFGYAFEQATRHRRAPTFASSVTALTPALSR